MFPRAGCSLPGATRLQSARWVEAGVVGGLHEREAVEQLGSVIADVTDVGPDLPSLDRAARNGVASGLRLPLQTMDDIGRSQCRAVTCLCYNRARIRKVRFPNRWASVNLPPGPGGTALPRVTGRQEWETEAASCGLRFFSVHPDKPSTVNGVGVVC